MALLLSDVKMPLSASISDIPALIAATFDIPRECVQAVRLVRQSLDARRKNDIHYTISIVAQMEPIWQARLVKRQDRRAQAYAPPEEYALPTGRNRPHGRIVVAGLGPAGLFAAYFLAQAGYYPLVLERGQPIEHRTQTVEQFWSGGALDENSNVMFGEGGAGAFSDGKLTARSKDSRVDTVLRTLVEFGAPEDIAYMARPHIGTDLLRTVVKQLREAIEKAGGEVRFQTTLIGMQLQDQKLTALRVQQNGKTERIPTAACVLATGQAARDTYAMLHESGLVLAPKPFSVGLRIEHPQEMINFAQYGALAGDGRLGAAEYRMTARSGARGVYTFCMCPGGQVVNASSGAGEVVVNGMSVRARNGENANAAIVVQVGPADFGNEPFSGVQFQQELEHKAFQAGGGAYGAPAQRLADFMAGSKAYGFGAVRPTCRPGVQPYNLNALLPGFVSEGIREGILAFHRQLNGFFLPDAILTAVESRTSAPLRVCRDENGQALGANGLYPVGEGAGYAGGIVSAAIDGMRAAEHIAACYAPGCVPE